MNTQDLLMMVPNWWRWLLSQWLKELKEDWYDIDKITYIKEKYWAMDIEWPRNWIFSELNSASRYFCEECWAAWRTRYDLWWYKTLCDEHYNSEISQKKIP